VLLKRRDTGLKKDSVANVSQIITIDRSFLDRRSRSIPSNRLADVDGGLQLILGL